MNRNKAVTMKDIAAMAGVSQPTVSLILNQKADAFPAETVERVLLAAKTLNYRVDRRRSTHLGRQTVLAVTVQATNPYYAVMLQSLDRAAIHQGIHVVSACTYHNPHLEAEALRIALEQEYLGVIFLYPPDDIHGFLKAMLQMPIVTICDKSSQVSGDIVEMNHFEAGSLAAQHLLDLGHRRIAVFSHTSDRNTTDRATRLAGILSAVNGVLGDECPLVLTDDNSWNDMLDEKSYHYEIGYKLAQDERIYQRGITGIICVNDLVAYGAMDALAEKGYRIPQDFSVIGSDNLLFSKMRSVSLTTIEYYPNIVAQTALGTLLNRTSLASKGMEHTEIARFHVQCQPTLVVRNSTGVAKIK